MPRRRKHHLPDRVFEGQRCVVSVTICTADRGRWLGEPELAELVSQEVLRVHHDHPVLGYCIMPDHIHLVVCNAEAPSSRIVGRFKGRISRRVHETHPELDLWQQGYWDHIVRRNEGLYAVLRYVLLNPVRKNLVQDWWDYRWLGSPMIGRVGPDFFGTASAEDIMWSEILEIR